MPRTSERGGPQTRERIAHVASGLFLERGFDAVTVAEIARAAGVSSVTVFNHFPRKEDLFLDRSFDAAELLRRTVRERGEGVGIVDALEAATAQLIDARDPLAGLDERSGPFLRTVAASPALISRARELAADLQRTLADELSADPGFTGDPALFAAFFVAGYAAVFTAAARRMLAGDSAGDPVADQRAAFARLFAALRSGIPA